MKAQEVQLTLIDRIILESHCSTLNGLAEYLGTGYEVVLHSLEDFEHSVIFILNGEHTGRKLGAPITNKALDMLELMNENGTKFEIYSTINSRGEPLKSTTIGVEGENGKVIGLLCLNFYMNTSFFDFIHSFIPVDTRTAENQMATETFAQNVDDMILSTLSAVKDEVYNDQSISASNKK